RAFGLDYDSKKAVYNLDTLTAVQQNFAIYEKDVNHHHEILKKWKRKNITRRWQKPKLVIVCVTGGGARSALWSYKAMQVADSITNGELMNHTQLMCGASGGLFGLAYRRELWYRAQSDSTINLDSKEYLDRMGMDVLNPIATSLAVNDWFVRFQKFRDGTYIYSKDRGYALETQFNKNTQGFIDKRLGDYIIPESEAQIPLMFFSPTIINDGRSLFISSQPIAHLTFNHPSLLKGQAHQSGVEFRRLFEHQDADNVWFTSVLRMSATFPYISPQVSLPSEPEIEVMDAGFRDNYGASIALKHLYAIRKWVEKNTSGVVILQIRDSKKIEPIKANPPRSLFNHITNPLGHIYDNLFTMQDYINDDLTVYAQDWLDADLETIDLELSRPEVEDISLSWHLTTKEKMIIEKSAYNEKNQEAIMRLKELLSESK
ncbi:MAG: patatin-like phospholipase family protein, partial [Flavobacteriales bacterium]